MGTYNTKLYKIGLLNNESYTNPQNDTSSLNILWGNFEFIKFTEATEFLSSDDNTLDFINTHSVYIYEVNKLPKLKYNNNSKSFAVANKGNKNSYKFIGVTLFNFSCEFLSLELPNLVNSDDGNLAISKICKEIQEKNNSEKYTFETYGTLNSHDLCIITLFDDICDYVSLIEDVQKSKYDNTYLFESSYSIITSSALNENHNENIFKDNNGIANIQITYNCNTSFDSVIFEVLNKLNLLDTSTNKLKEEYKNEVKIFSTLGEFDISIQLPINLLNNELYIEFLNPNANDYSKYIQQCNTRFSKIYEENTSQTEEEQSSLNISQTEEKQSSLLKKVNESFDKLKENELYQKDICFKQIFEMTFSDYNKAMSATSRNFVWADDLTEQFRAIISLALTALKKHRDNKLSFDIYEYALALANVFRQSVYRARQNNSFGLETIQSSFRNAITYDKVINCYYFLIKKILQYVYTFGAKEQSKLIPFINFEAVSLINSELISPADNANEKILSIYLPYDTFYNIERFLPLLYHEVGHYVSPKDRILRNLYAFHIIITHITNKIISLNNSTSVETKIEIYNQACQYFNINFIKNKYKSIFKLTWRSFLKEIKNLIFSILEFVSNSYVLTNENNLLSFTTDIKLFINSVNKSENKIKFNILRSKFCIEDVWNDIEGLMQGIREATADMFMIFNTGINLYEYLALIAFAKQYRNPLQEDNSVLTNTRIGIVLDYFMNARIHYDDIFILENDVINTVLDICKKFIPECSYNRVETFIKDIPKQFENFQNTWLPFLGVFQCMTDQVRLNNNIDEINQYDKDKKLCFELFPLYDFLSKNKFYKNSTENYLNLINLSFNQITLSELNKCTSIKQTYDILTIKPLSLKNKNDIEYLIPTYEISSYDQFNNVINIVHREISEANDVLWFRGQISSNWKLKPALFRSVKDPKCWYKVLNQSYHDFVAMSAGSVELTGTIRTEADWISYMQHYLIPTNFLDWTEQPLNALYFALENYFDMPCSFLKNDPALNLCVSKKARENNCQQYKDAAAIWVLNPKRMNNQINEMSGEKVLDDIDIPNLSIMSDLDKYNAKRFLFSGEKECTSSEHYPLAVTTARISSRIRSQKGDFVAFDLFTGDNYSINDIREKFIDLEKFHNDICKKRGDYGKEYKPFLAKIIIPYSEKENMSKYIKHMGITKSSIYPELDNIGIDVRRLHLEN